MVGAEPSTVEVVMARRPSVYVRELTPEEGQQLRRLSRRSKVFATRQRAQILLASDSHMAARQIADVLRTDENQVRRVIHEFNADGMASLHPPTGGGRPRRIDEPTRMRIRDVALARPGDLGEPGTRWSLSRLRRYLIRRRVVASISVEHLRRILRAHNVTAQRTRTWKTSTDPFYEPKRAWVLAAYQAAEAGPLGARHPPLGRRRHQQRGVAANTHQRQSPQPGRMPPQRPRRVRDQRIRLSRLDHLRQGHPLLHPTPQPRPSRHPHPRLREPA